MGSQVILSGTIICIFVSLLGSAKAAPPEASNKTVAVTWSQFNPANCADGSQNRVPRNISQSIYISTQGRLFAKLDARAGSASKGRLAEPSSGQFHFSGNKIVGTFLAVSGATQETISFDPSFQTCSAEVVAGTQSGKPWVWVNLVGVTCTATGKSVISSVACSVRPGNTFAN